jgi:Flp pilus assembly protein TadD
MFALLRDLVAFRINDSNQRAASARSNDFDDTSGAPLSDAVGHPKTSPAAFVFLARWRVAEFIFRGRRAMSRWRFGLLLVLTLSAIYLYAFPTAAGLFGVIYAGGVLLHVSTGILVAILLIPILRQVFQDGPPGIRVGWALLAAGTVLGLLLIKIGTPNRFRTWLYLHIALCSAGVLLVGASWLARRGWLGRGFAGATANIVALALVLTGAAAGSWWFRNVWKNSYRVVNPGMPAETMDGEGDGPSGKFFPSSVQTRDGKSIPAKYFMQSQACERCHADIYKQWSSSAHHFSSFNNQWYRRSVEYMQDLNGVRSSKWCAGCHDPALLFSGMFDTPVRQIENTPAAQAGLACMMCHSIVEVKSTMGQGDFLLEYPKLHELAASENPVMRALHDFMVKVNPEPHRRTFLKPFMREQTAEFCSGCHKVHLDVPVNNYRWVRGFNEYDNWQASGVSGQGARSFYYPANSMMCADCHMPLQSSKDEGNINGFVHSHRFPGANTAVPTANNDPVQLSESIRFLQDKQVTVDIFGISPAEKEAKAASPSLLAGGQELSTTFAVGEEAEASGPKGAKGETRPITAPLGRVPAAVRRGDDYLVDVVVRTRKVGHFFPGGTVDAFDVWLELQATDEKGQILFWSGKVEDHGKGPVEPGAHFYRSQQIDAHGNVINKRNAWSSRATVFVHLIPPGAADAVHYRLHIPDNAGDKINLHAKLNYRKFMWWNTQFAYAGEEDPGEPKGVSAPNYDDRKFSFHGDTSGVAGALKEIPNLPIITVAEDTKSISVLPHKDPAPGPNAIAAKQDWMRWNDYGIGLLLQGDLLGAETAFTKATEADPGNFDGWVNIGRVRTQEGDTAGAYQVLDKALAIKPDLARANYFYARNLKEDGKFDQAIEKLRSVLKQYPRDRVVRNELGRIYFLKKKYVDAVKEFEITLSIDPEDLQAHYNLMLCYNGLGDEAKAEAHKIRYLRFKADESSQAITGPYRQNHPEDNNERQSIHEHVSVALNSAKISAASEKAAAAQEDKGSSAGGKD